MLILASVLLGLLLPFRLFVAPISEEKPLKSSVNKSDSHTAVGTWRGQSVCVLKASSCRDEDSVYRFSANPKSEDRVILSGNKIVAGKEVNMGTGDCAYHRDGNSLDCTLPGENALHLEINGDAMTGKMTLQDGTLWRKIDLKRDEQNRPR